MADYQDMVVHYTTRIAVTSTHQLVALLPKLLRFVKNWRNGTKHGKQSLRRLNNFNRELASIPISEADLKAIKKEFKSFAVDFSIYRDKTDSTTHIFFKAQDVDRIYAALKHIAASRNIGQSYDNSLDDTIAAAKAKAEQKNAAANANKEKNKTKSKQRDKREEHTQ